MKDYVLVIYSPYNTFDVLAELNSETPFLAVNVGDSINPSAYDLTNYEELQSKLLRVKAVQHFITLTDDLSRAKHKIEIFTEIVTDSFVFHRITRADDEAKNREEMKKKLAAILNVSPDQLPDDLGEEALDELRRLAGNSI